MGLVQASREPCIIQTVCMEECNAVVNSAHCADGKRKIEGCVDASTNFSNGQNHPEVNLRTPGELLHYLYLKSDP
jgi:hypothetical protein